MIGRVYRAGWLKRMSAGVVSKAAELSLRLRNARLAWPGPGRAGSS